MTLDVFRRHALPANWEWRKLGDICEVRDRDHRTPVYQDDGVPLISPRDFIDNAVDITRLKRVAQEELAAFRKKCSPAVGDILFSRIGTIGEARLVDFDFDFVALHSIAMVKPRMPGLLSKFVLYLLKSPAVQAQARHSVKSVGTPDLGLNRIKEFEVPISGPSVQAEVVAEIEKQFSRLDEAVANLQRVKANLRRYTTSVLEEAFAGPASSSLGEVIKSGPQNGLYLPKSDYGSGTPILRIDDYQTGWCRATHDLRQVRASAAQIRAWALAEGDVVVNRVNSTTHLGKCLSVTAALAGALFESNMMRLQLRVEVLPRFVELYLGSKTGRARLTANAKWAVNQASINQQDVRATPMPWPPLAEQHLIIAEVDRRLSIVREVESEVDVNMKRAGGLRQAVLARAFAVSA